MRPQRILLAEDSPRDAELTLSALQGCHIANPVDLARDGADALDDLRRGGRWAGRAAIDPALLLLDLEMPRLGGLEVLERIKSDPELRRLPVVMLTSSRDEADLLRSHDLGANGYVRKPIRFADFAEAVTSLGVFWLLVDQPPEARAGSGA